MGLQQLNFDGRNKVEVAIGRIKEYEPPEGYYLCFSGGKDSVVIYDLAIQAGVKFDAHYSQTGIDPPELVYFIRQNYPSLDVEKPLMTMWQGIEQYGLPRQRFRWCCRVLKEHAGAGRCKLDGIRWAESIIRRQRSIFDKRAGGYLHPILDWSNEEVWEYIKVKQLPYCQLYDEGFNRLGCVLCPFSTGQQLKAQVARYPKIVEAYRKAAIRSWQRQTAGMQRWKSGEEYFDWWMER